LLRKKQKNLGVHFFSAAPCSIALINAGYRACYRT